MYIYYIGLLLLIITKPIISSNHQVDPTENSPLMTIHQGSNIHSSLARHATDLNVLGQETHPSIETLLKKCAQKANISDDAPAITGFKTWYLNNHTRSRDREPITGSRTMPELPSMISDDDLYNQFIHYLAQQNELQATQLELQKQSLQHQATRNENMVTSHLLSKRLGITTICFGGATLLIGLGSFISNLFLAYHKCRQ